MATKIGRTTVGTRPCLSQTNKVRRGMIPVKKKAIQIRVVHLFLVVSLDTVQDEACKWLNCFYRTPSGSPDALICKRRKKTVKNWIEYVYLRLWTSIAHRLRLLPRHAIVITCPFWANGARVKVHAARRMRWIIEILTVGISRLFCIFVSNNRDVFRKTLITRRSHIRWTNLPWKLGIAGRRKGWRICRTPWGHFQLLLLMVKTKFLDF